MLLRFVSGLIGIPLLVILVFTAQGTPFVLGIGLMSIIGLYEFYRGVRTTGAEPQEWVGLASSLLFLFAAQNRFDAKGFSIQGIVTCFVLVAMTVEMLRKKRRAPIKNLGATFLGAIYAGWLFSYLVAINSVGGTESTLYLGFWHWSVRTGAWFVLFVSFAAWAADTGAYLVGRKWGAHKMVPVLSPGKSWEGFLAGVASAVGMSLLMGRAVGMPWGHLIILGVGIAALGLIGDLAESSLKRDIGFKDFGSILPGHGGILDRFDGLLFAAPFFYYYVTFILKY